jgi:sensor c-di-GMP phosphodiesterase-like protein
VTTRWTNLPAHLSRAASRLDRHRYAMLVAVSATWIALYALVFTSGDSLTRPRAIAMAVALPLAFVGSWVFLLWAWFRRAAVSSSGARSQVGTWIRVVLLLAFGAIAIFMSWNVARLLLHL